jgi:hypothetical protein
MMMKIESTAERLILVVITRAEYHRELLKSAVCRHALQKNERDSASPNPAPFWLREPRVFLAVAESAG